jgi:hypothetical protein
VVTSKRDPRWLIEIVNYTAPMFKEVSDRRMKLTEIPNLYGQTLEEFYREQDLVMTVQGLVYSERVKTLFEKECPGNAEFAPIEIRGTPVLLERKYFRVHAVHAMPLDCIRKETALIYEMKGMPEDSYYFRFEIDPTKVPEHIKFFCLADGTYRHYVRDSLRRSMMRAKMLGALYAHT